MIDSKQGHLYLYSVVTSSFVRRDDPDAKPLIQEKAEAVPESELVKFYTFGMPFVARNDEEAKDMYIAQVQGERLRIEHSPKASNRVLSSIDFDQLFLVRIGSFFPFQNYATDPVVKSDRKCTVVYDPRPDCNKDITGYSPVPEQLSIEGGTPDE